MDIIVDKSANSIGVKNSPEKNKAMDIFKLIAAYGVILVHVPSSTFASEIFSTFFSPLRVPYFFLLSLSFLIISLKKITSKQIIEKTWYRLIIPYLSWTLIYMALFGANNLLLGGDRTFEFWNVVFKGDSAVHMYFIPELLKLQFLTMGFFLVFSEEPNHKRIGIFMLGLFLFYIIWGHLNNFAKLGYLFGAFIFLGCSYLFSQRIKVIITRLDYVIIGIVIVVTAILFRFLEIEFILYGYPLLYPLGGIGLMLITIGIPKLSVPSWVSYLATTTYGIYLAHVLFLEGFELIIKVFFPNGLTYNLFNKIIITSLIFISSAMFSLIARKIPLTKLLLLGEKK